MANGTLGGSVIDISTNQPIANAAIDATSESSAQEYKTTSNNDGDWGPESVPAGIYDLTVTADGYAEGVYPGIVVIENVTTMLPFALHRSDYFD